MWFPEWPLRRPGTSPDEPCQAVDDDNRVAAVNGPAAAAGIRPGMARGEAEAICPRVVTLRRDLGKEAADFEPVVAAVEEVVPRVEVAEPGLLFVPVSGAVRYYGGEAPLADRVLKEAESAGGPGVRLGLAAGPFAARRAADLASEGDPIHIVTDDAAFLASLDVAAIAPEDLVATFRWLGVTTLGDLARLPRAAVLSRFGRPGLEAHRIASGEDRSLAPRRVSEDQAVEERFVPPLEVLEQAGFAARALAARLVERLMPTGSAPYRVEVEAEAAGGEIRRRVWRSADPMSEAELGDRVWWQLRAWVEGGGIPGGLARLRLAPGDLSDEGRQLALDEDATTEAEAARSFARVQALGGPDAVRRARAQGGRDPLERVQWYRWGEEAAAPERDPAAPWPGRLPGPSPALVPPQPIPLEVEWDGGMPVRIRLGSRWEPVLSWAGPWRRLGRWWKGEGSCDRYQVVTSAGAVLCEVRAGRTYLSGIYD